MRVVVSLPTIGSSAAPDDVVRLARYAERAGLDGVSVPDLIIGDGTPSLECVVTLAAVAGATSTIGLAFGVLVLPLRQPALLVAQLAALQRISGGRLTIGVGTGGFPGTPFWRAAGGPENGRGRHTDDVLAALPTLFEEIAGLPMPPVHVGGTSDAALRRAARYGQGWQPSLLSEARLADRLTALRELTDRRLVVDVGTHLTLDAAARDAFVGDLVRLHGMEPADAAEIPLTGAAGSVAARLERYADAGADGVTVAIDGDWNRGVDVLAEARAMTLPT